MKKLFVIIVAVVLSVLSVAMLSNDTAAIIANNWDVEWYQTRSGPVTSCFNVSIQNLDTVNNRDFNLSLIFRELNIDSGEIRNVYLAEWKDVPVSYRLRESTTQ